MPRNCRRLGPIVPALISGLLAGGARGQESSARPPRSASPTSQEFVVSLPPPVQLGDRPDGAELLRFPAVVADLGLTNVQAGKLARDERLRTRHLRDVARSLRRTVDADPDAADLDADGLAAVEEVVAIDADSVDAVDRALTPTQRGRLFQIGLRRDGVLALARDDVAEALGLDNDARDALVPILEGSYADLLDAASIRLTLRSSASRAGNVPVLGTEDLAAFEARVALAREADLRIRELAAQEADLVLTRRQREEFARLMGPPFDVAVFRPMPAVKPVPSEARP